jgi:hypothetical protein
MWAMWRILLIIRILFIIRSIWFRSIIMVYFIYRFIIILAGLVKLRWEHFKIYFLIPVLLSFRKNDLSKYFLGNFTCALYIKPTKYQFSINNRDTYISWIKHIFKSSEAYIGRIFVRFEYIKNLFFITETVYTMYFRYLIDYGLNISMKFFQNCW